MTRPPFSAIVGAIAIAILAAAPALIDHAAFAWFYASGLLAAASAAVSFIIDKD